MNNTETFPYGVLQEHVQPVTAIMETAKANMLVDSFPNAESFVKVLRSQMELLSPVDLPDALSEDRLKDAFNALLIIRVKQINGEMIRKNPSLSYKEVVYPAFLFPLLASLGTIESKEDAVRITVSLGAQLTRLESNLDWDEVAETLDVLDSFGTSLGLEMAEAMPKSTTGRLFVMMLVNDSGNLRSAKNVPNAADLLIRSTLDFEIVDYVWGTLRWNYGGIDEQQTRFKRLIRNCFRIRD